MNNINIKNWTDEPKVSEFLNKKSILHRDIDVPSAILPEITRILEDNYISHGIVKTNLKGISTITLVYDINNTAALVAITNAKNLIREYNADPVEFLCSYIDRELEPNPEWDNEELYEDLY